MKHAIKTPFMYLYAIGQYVKTVLYRLFSRSGRYTFAFICLSSTIWSIAIATAILLPERYESKSTLILPGAGVGGRVDIDNIGSASAIVNSAFSSRNLSPKVSYKSIAMSSKVLTTAAQSLSISKHEYGKPRVKLVDQTALMFFSISDSNPEMARKKSYALYEALQTEIQRLREDELNRREEGIQKMLKTFSNKLNIAKNNLLKYQANSDIATIEQYNRIPIQIENMRAQLADLHTQKDQGLEELMTLHRILGLTSMQASQLMSLQADPLFKKLLENQSNANALLSEYDSKWGAGHHKVKQQSLTAKSMDSAILDRAKTLVGTQTWLTKKSLGNHPKRNELMYDLITKKSSYEGFKKKISQLESQIKSYQLRIQEQSTSVSKLDELERQHQIAEAVFTSAVAKIDTGKSDIFASYPMLQLFMEPTLPERTSGAKKEHVYIGAVLGTVLSALILTLLWIRRRNIEGIYCG